MTLSPAPDAPYLLIATGRILEGSLAVATKNGTPISFAIRRRTRRQGKPSSSPGPAASSSTVFDGDDLPTDPAAAGARLAVRGAAQRAPGTRLGRGRLAPVSAGRRHRPHRLVRVGPAVARPRERTSSSCASTSPRRRRASSRSSTAARRCRSSPKAGRGCRSRRRSAVLCGSSPTAPSPPAVCSAISTRAKAARSGIRRAASTCWGTPTSSGHSRRPPTRLTRGLHHLVAQRRDLPAGTFVFVISDFLERPSRDDWLLVLERRFEIVPVIVQDPIWEQSFPDVSGAAVPFADATTGRVTLAALREDEAAERREENETRFRELVREFHGLAMDPVVVSSHEHRDVVFSFLSWADQRLMTRGRP